MPRISTFYGIGIWMYWNEGTHARPHFHARYADHAASIDLEGELIAGSLPSRALRLVAEVGPPPQKRARRQLGAGPSQQAVTGD